MIKFQTSIIRMNCWAADFGAKAQGHRGYSWQRMIFEPGSGAAKLMTIRNSNKDFWSGQKISEIYSISQSDLLRWRKKSGLRRRLISDTLPYTQDMPIWAGYPHITVSSCFNHSSKRCQIYPCTGDTTLWPGTIPSSPQIHRSFSLRHGADGEGTSHGASRNFGRSFHLAMAAMAWLRLVLSQFWAPDWAWPVHCLRFL